MIKLFVRVYFDNYMNCYPRLAVTHKVRERTINSMAKGHENATDTSVYNLGLQLFVFMGFCHCHF